MNSKKITDVPELPLLEEELKREKTKRRYRNTLKSTTSLLVVVAAVAVLIATIFLPVLRIYGQSMTPTVNEGDIVFSLKGSSFKQGDVVAFYFNNKILVKRVIAGPGQWVDIDKEGNVYVDGKLIDEPYIEDKAYGDCNLELPYQVPDGRYFVMGDHRSTSQDSRDTMIGCVADEQIVGKILFRVWPLSKIGTVR